MNAKPLPRWAARAALSKVFHKKCMNHHISKNELTTYLYAQDDPRIASLCYGRAKQKIERSGCGLVAIYNVMKRLGKAQPFPDIIRDAQRLHMPWLFGFFGTKPRSLRRYFKLHGVPFRLTNDCADFKESLAAANAAVLCTWNDKRTSGIHFYAVFNDNGKLTALNRYCGNAPTAFSAEDVRADRFICGYLFERVES